MTMPTTATIHITGDASDAASAISGPWGLANWYCGFAHSERAEGGRLYIRWQDGRHALGRWRVYAPPHDLEWALLADDGVATVATFTLTDEDQGARVTVEGTGTRDDWPLLLENLKGFVETGRDARETRRPMMGIQFELVTTELAKQRHLPVTKGILVTGLTEAGAALESGVQKLDILAELGGHPTDDYDGLVTALSKRRAGETVEAVLWRGGDKMSLPLTLKSRPQPELPQTIPQLLDAARAQTERLVSRLHEVLEGLTDAEASTPPSPGEWSVREVLAHLTIGERFGLENLARIAGDDTPPDWAERAERLLHHAMSQQPAQATTQALVDILRENLALVEVISSQSPAPRVFRQLGSHLRFTNEHFSDHFEQIGAAVTAHRAAVPDVRETA